ncbi:MAG TPA: shikimate dehydrogenase [Burkholderiales bacterium]|nr:shikimate dehydrogenase [Burkholderiales bacterium]
MIDGNTLIFATPGDPVAQVRLPEVMEAVFAALGVNAVWVPMHVGPEGLAAVLQGLRTIRNFRGITVAIPYKPAVGAMLDRLTPRAQASGSVNLVRLDPDGKLLGDIVDGAGFVRGLELCGYAVKGATAWLVGVGGGGSAIAAALAEAGVARLYLTELNKERAAAIHERLGRYYPKTPLQIVHGPPDRVDFAINATPCGLGPDDPMPFDPSVLSEKTVVCDIIMKPRETRLLQAAQVRGMRVHHGQHMLDAQIPMYLEFLGIPFPDERAVMEISSRA